MAKRSFKRFVEEELGKFPQFVIFAVLEWMLIIMLFIDGFLSFAANEFAKFFELRIPCLLCTRIDHVLVRRNPNFYYNESICNGHMKEVSSLAYCHVHKKLSDIRKMCEGCLLSFATEKESGCNTYKSLVGILHKDLECFVDDDHEIHLALPASRKDDAVPVEKSSIQLCACCGDPLKVKSSYVKGKNAAMLSQAPAPSPRAAFSTLRNDDSRNLDLPHIRYKELKLTLDNESELPENEDRSYVTDFSKQLREDLKAAAVPLLTEGEDTNEDKTPTFIRGNKFFGIPLSDSASASPRWTSRLSRRSPLERTENASETVEGNVSNETDGDAILTHLKRQVRVDRKSLMALYMELDEERSASAVAANNAMAMITRLQAEKAAVQMEALQYQRMMEEQNEYDQEALQETINLLVKREEDVKALEAEIEVYRKKYGCLREEDYEGREDETDDEYQEFKSESYTSYSGISESSSPPNTPNEGLNNGEISSNHDRTGSLQRENGGGIMKSVNLFKGDRSCQLDRLKKFEKRTNSQSDDGVVSSQSSSDTVNNTEEEIGKGSKSIITRELARLHERVKALEADDGFLKHASHTLQISGGTNLLTEISNNLQKLQHFVTMPFEDNDA